MFGAKLCGRRNRSLSRESIPVRLFRMDGIQNSFGTVLWIVIGLSSVAALIAFVASGKQWKEYGRDGLGMDRDLPPSTGRAVAASPAAIRERDEEIRELLEARNERRRRRGEAVVDVEAELRRLTAPAADDGIRAAADDGIGATFDEGIRAEIRDLVIARNHRRARAGKPQLDVEAEIAREIEGLRELA